MPGVLSYAAPTTVLPASLWALFSPADAWPNVGNDYPDGSGQRRVDGANPRHTWRLTARLTYSAWATLSAFYTARRGAFSPFYFYPLMADYDATGASAVGRYTVRFDGEMSSTFGLARGDTPLSLVEVA